MGFRLPVIGYVAPRGVGGENSPENSYNAENMTIVERVIDRIEMIYNNNRENGTFFFGGNADHNRAFIGTFFETSRSDRNKLRDILAQLPEGGMIVSPNVRHVVELDDMSSAIIRANMHPLTGFLFTDELRFMPIRNMQDIEACIFMAMSNLRRVENSMVQIEHRNAPRNRRRNAFLGV